MTTLGAEYFDGMYSDSEDPWGFTSRWYEQRKYAITLAMLPQERYGHAFEPGCSIGVLSARLAPRCGRLLCCDVAPAAVAAARQRTASWPHARVDQRVLPGDWPGGDFDLIVFSEILYYFGGADLQAVVDLGTGALRPGGTMMAVHWRHRVPEYPRSGDEVHAVLARQHGLARLAEHREADFVAEVYLRTDGEAVSVAQAGGLVDEAIASQGGPDDQR